MMVKVDVKERIESRISNTPEPFLSSQIEVHDAMEFAAMLMEKHSPDHDVIVMSDLVEITKMIVDGARKKEYSSIEMRSIKQRIEMLEDDFEKITSKIDDSDGVF